MAIGLAIWLSAWPWPKVATRAAPARPAAIFAVDKVRGGTAQKSQCRVQPPSALQDHFGRPRQLPSTGATRTTAGSPSSFCFLYVRRWVCSFSRSLLPPHFSSRTWPSLTRRSAASSGSTCCPAFSSPCPSHPDTLARGPHLRIATRWPLAHGAGFSGRTHAPHLPRSMDRAPVQRIGAERAGPTRVDHAALHAAHALVLLPPHRG